MGLTDHPSFKHYGKMDSHNASAANALPGATCLPVGPNTAPHSRKSKRRVVIIGLLSVGLIAVICVAIAVAVIRNDDSEGQSAQKSSGNIITLCQGTLYPDECQQSLVADNATTSNTDPQSLVSKSVKVSSSSVSQMGGTVDSLMASETDPNVTAALRDCRDLLDDALDNLDVTAASLSSFRVSDLLTLSDDLSNSMSTALTDKTTCLDGFDRLPNGTAKNTLSRDGQLVEQHLSIALALVTSFTKVGSDVSNWQADLTNRGLLERRLLGESDESPELLYPIWIDSANRRLLASDDISVNIDAVVAGDGTGQHTTIQAAVNAAPSKSKKRYVIFVKEGTYREQVTIYKNKTYVMLMGAGVGKTVITGSLNVQMPGVTTFLSATLIVAGTNFIGRNFTVRNEAGPQNFQAVAMRVSADKSAFYQIWVEGFQDTLYAHSQRQFYKSSTIMGTVDFIFGNGAAVFQTCKLVLRLPSPGQQNTLTAQGRTDPSQNTGLAFYNCFVDGMDDLKRQNGAVSSYLGRPWKLYSRTVYINTYLPSLINPAGWLIWVGDWALSTCYYAEYESIGPGADVSQRVPWSHQIKSAGDANKFSINRFINGNKWLPATNIPFDRTTL